MNRRIAHTAQIVALVLALAVVPIALAAKGGGGGKGHGGTTGGSASITGPFMVTDTGTPGLSFGDTVTFQVSTTATTEPWVNLKCYQGRALVAEGWNGYFDASLTGRNFGLSSPKWTGGAADCTAYVTTPQWVVLGSTSFHVNP